MKKRTARRLFVVPGVVLLGILVMAMLIMARKPPALVDKEPLGTLVNVMIAEKSDRDLMIIGHGDVRALHQIGLTPQVSGQVVWVHPDFLAGGSFNKGDALLSIEPADFELGVQQADAMVAQATYQLEVTQANAEVALTEWNLVKGNDADSGEPSSLVLYEPQMRQAEANLQSAEAALAKAELNLSRTTLHAPFNCKIASKNVSPGQQIGPQAAIAQLYSTDIAEIEVSLQPSQLSYIEIPGAKVDVILENGKSTQIFEGIVHRQVGVIGEMGRLARIVVRIEDPFRGDNPLNPTMSLGAFVEARIHGTTVRDIFAVPRSAVHSDGMVWVAEDNSLTIRPVEVYYKTQNEILVTTGIENGDLVILTPISGAAKGMKLRYTMPETSQ
jgi:RND family efflux transporter MFP subunit